MVSKLMLERIQSIGARRLFSHGEGLIRSLHSASVSSHPFGSSTIKTDTVIKVRCLPLLASIPSLWFEQVDRRAIQLFVLILNSI
jgi:hypothetical protein